MKAPVKPRHYITGANGFFVAAQGLYKHGGQLYWPAFYVNLCYAIELSLKAFLLHSGKTEEQVTSFGHDLVKTLHACIECGYPENVDLEDIVQILGPLHMSHHLRYLRDQAINVPIEAQAIEIIEGHLRTIADQINLDNL